MKKIEYYFIRICSILFILMIFVALILSRTTSDAKTPWYGNVNKCSYDGQYSVNGGEFQAIPSNYVLDVAESSNDIVTIGHFNESIGINQVMMFRLEYLGIEMYVNGNRVFESGLENGVDKESNRIGNVWVNYISSGITPKDTVVFKLHDYYPYDSQITFTEFFSQIYYGSEMQFFAKTMSHHWLGIIFGAFAAIIGFTIFIVSLFVKPKLMKKRLLLFSSFSFFGGIWLLWSYDVMSLICHFHIFNDVVICASLICAMIAITLYMETYMTLPKSRTLMLLCVCIQLLNGIIIFVLQMISTFHMYSFIFAFVISNSVLVIFVLITTTAEWFVTHSKKMLYNLITIFPMMIGFAIDGARLLLKKQSVAVSFDYTAFGFLFFMICQIFTLASIVRKNNAEKEKMITVEKELNDSKIASMMSQIQPHFIYNVLSTISALCTIEPEKAERAIDDFSVYLRGNLDSLSEKNIISFDRELNHVKHYIDLEKIRFEDLLEVQYDIEDTDFYLPALTVQPIVENAIRYGIFKKDCGGTVKLSVYKTTSSHIIEVLDNGVGFNVNEEKKDGREHVGLKNVAYRLETMSGGNLLIESKIGVGTKVTITIPKEH